MRELKLYVESNNAAYKMFGERELDLDNANDRNQLAQTLAGDLSPENLSCDGELPMSEVRKRYNFYTKALKQLKKLDPSLTVSY